MLDVFNTNVVGPLLVTQALLPMLRRSFTAARAIFFSHLRVYKEYLWWASGVCTEQRW
jgi:NAD(P)-dependent dehydrogenase (short-subunit alcohol dehydrogenase family)